MNWEFSPAFAFASVLVWYEHTKMEQPTINRQKAKVQCNLSISSPPPKTKKEMRHNGGPTATRLYVAPHSSIRQSDTATTSVVSDTNARRRRQQQPHDVVVSSMLQNQSPQTSPSDKSSTRRGSMSKQKKVFLSNQYRSSNCHHSDHSSSSDSILGSLEAPCLWMDDVEGYVNGTELSNSWSRAACPPKGESRQRKYPRSHKINSSGSVASERHTMNGDDASVHTLHTIHSLFEIQSTSKLAVDAGNADLSQRQLMKGKHVKKTVLQQQFSNIRGCNNHGNRLAGCCIDRKSSKTSVLVLTLQGIVLLAFAFVLYDSRRQHFQHRLQLQQLDEERAHILDQMTWIDNAAKKVHKKYSTGGYNEKLLQPGMDIKTSNPDEHDNFYELNQSRDENKILKLQIEQMQLRVQQNARSRTNYQFGDKPVQVSLPIQKGDVLNGHLVIALSDDAPHAVNTFLQQVSNGLWNEVDYQQIQKGYVIQATTQLSDTEPILEFVEKSRGCHKAGSVALHQLEYEEFHVLVLKIHMQETSGFSSVNDVCIGNVLSGIDLLEKIIPHIPAIYDSKVPVHQTHHQIAA
jgi:cyclophilin family peptidyl-prolyl cis-trans isomerase